MAGQVWLTDADIKQALADVKKLADASQLKGYWDNLIGQGNTFAVGAVRRAFVKRGLAVGDVALWQDRAEYQRDLALWKVSVLGAMRFTREESVLLAKLNRVKELETEPFLKADGTEIKPDTAAEGSSQVGFMASSTDAFRHPLAAYPNVLAAGGVDDDPLREILTGER